MIVPAPLDMQNTESPTVNKLSIKAITLPHHLPDRVISGPHKELVYFDEVENLGYLVHRGARPLERFL